MEVRHYLHTIIQQQKQGILRGVYSVCSANPYVVEATLEFAKEKGTVALIEATSNQVNQYGGYTQMTPADFVNFVEKKANAIGFPLQNLILGGDHLGPNPWQDQVAEIAMDKACHMVSAYVLAGFTKIHLDASMRLGDDPGDSSTPLAPEIIAQRAALLAKAAEGAYKLRKQEFPQTIAPVYVIGTEVPVPGGGADELEELQVTDVCDFKTTVATNKAAFEQLGLNDAWERVIAVVVQPGVEFDIHTIYEYDQKSAKALSVALSDYSNLVFEGHSTDYQTKNALREMVEDGVAILKVGPGLTFAMREALFSLAYIERELCFDDAANLIEVLEKVMIEEPANWHKYYSGNDLELSLARKYSLSDRSRYYWNNPEVSEVVAKLINNLDSKEIPLTLVSQFMPIQYERIRQGNLALNSSSLIKDRIKNVLEQYHWAIGL